MKIKKFTVMCAVFSGLLVGSTATAVVPATASAADKDQVTIYLTRHGETTGNVMQRVQGSSDFPLTKNGIKVANDLGYGLKGIKFKHAYTGNLTRQEVTAEHALKYSGNKDTKITTTPKLREGGYGSFEGDSIEADNQKIANVYGYSDGKQFQEQTGKDYWNRLQDAYHTLDKQNSENTKLAKSDRAESSKQVQNRMNSELLHIAKTTQKQGGGNVLVVSSGMSINEYLSTISDKYEGKPMQNAAVTKLVYKNGKLHVQGPIGTLHYVNKGQKIADGK
ncbi:histidine phosphatase family protein [Limosilactobacillus caccae]|jgi:probable phosphoglycerate mutase|uniref:histidine phosphatase family protein n=1 Tax=Limosilactobacillus caccae TaxID=1926284 RepID=UPI00097124EE|nr:histidine phosphatase family protein [Limosilactobacillus caccae]